MLCSTRAVRTVCNQSALPRGQHDQPTQGQHDQSLQGPSPSPSSTVSISFLYTAFFTHGLQGVLRYPTLPSPSSQWPKSRCTTAFSSLSTLNSLALSTTSATATTHRLLPENAPPHHPLRHPRYSFTLMLSCPAHSHQRGGHRSSAQQAHACMARSLSSLLPFGHFVRRGGVRTEDPS